MPEVLCEFEPSHPLRQYVMRGLAAVNRSVLQVDPDDLNARQVVPWSIRLAQLILVIGLIGILIGSLGIVALVVLSVAPTHSSGGQLPLLVGLLAAAVIGPLIPLLVIVGLGRLSRLAWRVAVWVSGGIAAVAFIGIVAFGSRIHRFTRPEEFGMAVLPFFLLFVLLVLPPSRNAVRNHGVVKRSSSRYAKRRRQRRRR